MIITNIKTWMYQDNLESLLFFSQRILELAYDKSDFKEKNISVDFNDIINEILDLIEFQKEVKEDISTTELEILILELKDRIYKDEVIKIILGDKIENYISKLSVGCDRNILTNTLEVLKLKINPYEYYSNSKNLIKNLIIINKNRDKLFDVTTRLFEFLIWYGYQKGTIYFLTNRYFFDRNGSGKITSTDDVDGFFELFDLKEKEFEVAFVASRLFTEIQDSCKKFNLSVIESRDPLYNETLESKFFKNVRGKKVFLVCNNIKAVDYLHAMKVAEKRISLVSDLFVVFHHKHKPWHSDYCLVYKHDKNTVIKLYKPSNIMTNKSEDDFTYAKDIFPIFLKRFSLEKDSFNRFNRGVELHALSLETNEVASQILNFWICLEALLITNKGKTHIATVTEYIQLIISHYALRERIDNLTACIKLWDNNFKAKITSPIPPEIDSLDPDEFVAALVTVVKYKPLAGELLSSMQHQPLLRFKFMLCVKSMQNRKGVTKILEKQNLKCERDIRRIYRSRNKIVHQGNISDHNEYIAEMAHYYLDLVLFSIIERKIKFNDIRSIDNLVNELKISKERHEKYIKDAGEDDLTEKNFSNVIYGSRF